MLAAACVCLASAAAAQTPKDVRRDAEVHLGALYLTPTFAIKEFGVDTNVFNSRDEKSDFTFTFAPRVRLWVPFGRRALMTTGVASDVVYYQRYGSERSINPDVTMRGEAFLGRVTPFLEAGYLRSRQRPNYEIDARSVREQKRLRAGVGVRLASKVTIEASAAHEALRYDADAKYNDVRLRETLNRTTTTTSIEARYAATPLTTFVLRAESDRDRFELSPLRDADSVTVLPGVELKPLALISGSAHVGIRRFEPTSLSLERFTGVVAAASLSYVLRGATKVTFTAERDLTYSYERLQPYYIVDGYGLTVRRQIVGPLDVTGGVQRHEYGYRDLVLPGEIVTDLDRVDVTRTWFGSVGYRLGGAMRAGFGTVYRSRGSSSTRSYGYSGYRFITTLDYEL
jgi:hypothetical protein